MPLYEETLDINSFIEGIDQSVNQNLLPPTSAYKCINCNIDDGTLKRVKGSTSYVSTSVTNADDLMVHYNDGDATFLIGKNGDILDTSNNVLLSGSGGKWDYINYQKNMEQITIFTNGTNNVKAYDGNSFRNLESGNSGVYDGLAPKGKYIELHRERVWISGDEDAPNTLYFSDDLNPDDWTFPTSEGEANEHGGFIDVPTWDGGVIIGIKNMFDDLVVFKTHNVFRIFGTYPGNYTITQIFQTTNGRIIESSIASRENTVIWLTTEGIYHFGGTNTTPMHMKIQEEFKRINMDYIDNARAVIYDNKYILAVPCDDSAIPNVVFEYNLITSAWTIREGLEIKDIKVIDDKVLFVNDALDIHEYNIGENYSTSEIDSIWEGGNLDFDALNAKKNILKLYFTGSGNGDVKFECITDRKTVEKIVTLVPDEMMYKIRLKNKGRLVKFRITNIDGSDFTIKKPRILYDVDID